MSMAKPAGPDASKHGIYRDYTFAWNQIGANNVFRLRWDVCGQTKMKDYSNERWLDMPAI